MISTRDECSAFSLCLGRNSPIFSLFVEKNSCSVEIYREMISLYMCKMSGDGLQYLKKIKTVKPGDNSKLRGLMKNFELSRSEVRSRYLKKTSMYMRVNIFRYREI